MSMGLVVLIIWLLNITEHHCVNTPNSNSLFTHCLRNYTKKRVCQNTQKLTKP